MGGGDRAAFDACREAFSAFATSIHYLGPAGAGQVGKMVNNLGFDTKWALKKDQAKVAEHAGHRVKVTGTLNGDTIKVENIVVDSGCIPGPTGCQ